jgi:alginate O-acetyltransferase complex protein AlgI
MVFSSITFISVFLPAVLLLYYVLPKICRNYVLLVFSIIFYAWGEPIYVFLMLASICVNWLSGILIDKFRNHKTPILVCSLIANLGILGYFKYAGMFVETVNAVLRTSFTVPKIALPIGISFFTFQALSYVVDVYKGECKAQYNWFKLALFISLFPQLIAGPIVKYHDIEDQINERSHTFDLFCHGLKRFIIGFARKVLIANTLGAVADQIFEMQPNQISCSLAWLGAICYSFQLFFDFSGYADMAIGCGEMFGFHITENFKYPYISQSITEFWRRWHISLSTWFRDYLYIPLGGNRKGNVRTYINLFIVFFATGLWHGASWTFVVWGLWHGLFIIIERITGFHKKEGGIVLGIVRHIYTLMVVLLGWVLFRADDFDFSMQYIATMFGFGGEKDIVFSIEYFMRNTEWIVMAAALLCSMPIFENLIDKAKAGWKLAIVNLWLILLYLLSFMSMASSTYQPFLYFRF